ncbi:hypothetical protein YV76_004645 [Salmonella enterica subsp. enterica]|nr:hypothetical protein [Salmonella enterica subsp. enterica]
MSETTLKNILIGRAVSLNGRPLDAADGPCGCERAQCEWQYRPGADNPHEKLSAVIRADGGAETFRYDGEGKIAFHTGAMGQTTRYLCESE